MAKYRDTSLNSYNVNPSNIINELYHEAITTGNAPGNYCKVQILGDERVGKTSLRKNLMGETFDPNEQSTIGIDTTMCNVKEVDETWREINDSDRSEFDDIVSWFCSKRFWGKTEPAQTSKFKRPVFGVCFLLILTFVVERLAFAHIQISNCVSSIMWMACITLFATAHVQSYLFLCRLAETIFSINLGGYLLFGYGLPRSTWSFSCLLIYLEFGLTVTFQTRMGRSVILAVQLLSISSKDNDGSWQNQLSFQDKMILATGFIVGRHFLPRMEYLMRQLPIIVYVRARMRQLSLVSRVILVASVLVSFSVCFSMIFVQNSAFLVLTGLYSGVGFALGLVLGDRLSVSPLLNTIMKHHWFSLPFEILHGWLLVSLSCRALPSGMSDSLNVLQSGFIPLIIADKYRNHLLEYNQTTARVAQKVLKSEKEKLSMNLSIWDFAGQKLYYNTHHTFMSLHAVYIIVFNLKDFSECTSRSLMLQRIMFWISSVQQHANSSTILVGTHEDCVDEKVIANTHDYLSNCLRSQNLVYNQDSVFFTVDNSKMSHSGSGIDDIDILRRTIQSEAQNMKHIMQEYPIRWRRFYEFITEWRSASARSPYIKLSELQNIVTRFHINTTKELINMLAFFHDNGEIIYDSVDSVLRQFVVLDPQVMIDIMQALVVVPTYGATGMYVGAWKQFERTGILEYKLLEHIILSRLSLTNETTSQVIIGMLQAKDLICKIERTKCNRKPNITYSNLREEFFVVPSMLPSTTTSLSPNTVAWNKRVYVDFGPMLPDAVFLRLMSRCASYSDVVSVCEDQCQLFSDGGFFTLGTNYFFMLRRIQPCDEQYLVEVSIKAAHDWHPLEVLKYLCSILDTLRCRDFPGLQYTAGVMCPRKAPHQGCKDERMMHVLDLHTEMETEESTIHRWCNGREIHADVEELESPLSSTEDNLPQPITVNVQGDNNFVVVGGKQSRIVINRGESSCKEDNIDSEGEKDEHESSTELGIDVFISSSPHDEGWVQETLVRYLTGPPHYLVVCLNQYDVHSQALHVRRQNAKQIETSAVFLAVCSRYYRKDATGRLTFEREVARRCNVPIVGISRDCDKSDVADMFDVDEVSFSSDNSEAMGRSLDLLSTKILDKISEQIK